MILNRRFSASKVLRHGPLALINLDFHCSLIVLEGREDLGLLDGKDSVAANELGHVPTLL